MMRKIHVIYDSCENVRYSSMITLALYEGQRRGLMGFCIDVLHYVTFYLCSLHI